MNARKTAILILAVGVATVGATLLVRSLHGPTDERKPGGPTAPSKGDPSATDLTETPRNGHPRSKDPLPRTSGGTLRLYVHALGTSVAEAQVTALRADLRPMDRKTGPDGTCLLEGLSPGEWEVGVRHARYMPAHADVTVREGATSDLTVELRAGARVFGRVSDARGLPVGNAEVDVRDPEKLMPLGMGLKTKTDAEGRYEIDGIPPGSVTLWVISNWHRSGKKDLVLSHPGEVVEANLELAAGNTVTGRVVDEETGAPIPKATVQGFNDLGSICLTDEEGKFTIYRLGDGPVTITARAQGYGNVNLRGLAPGSRELTIRLPRAGSLKGEIEADPFPEYWEVSVWRYDEDFRKEIRVWAEAFPQQDSGKEFHVKLLPPGAYVVRAEAPGYELESPLSVTVERGRQMSNLVLRLRKK